MRPSDWLKPTDIRDDITHLPSNVPWEVFRGEPRADDIRQGGVGNCWFVCALSILADRAPDVLKKCLISQKFAPHGAYLARLCLAGQWRTILIDDLLPCNALEVLAYTRRRRNLGETRSVLDNSCGVGLRASLSFQRWTILAALGCGRRSRSNAGQASTNELERPAGTSRPRGALCGRRSSRRPPRSSTARTFAARIFLR